MKGKGGAYRGSHPLPPEIREPHDIPMLVFATIGPMEWVIIAMIVILLFGARKLPELARSLGSSVTQFKKGLKSGDEPASDSKRENDRTTP